LSFLFFFLLFFFSLTAGEAPPKSSIGPESATSRSKRAGSTPFREGTPERLFEEGRDLDRLEEEGAIEVSGGGGGGSESEAGEVETGGSCSLPLPRLFLRLLLLLRFLESLRLLPWDLLRPLISEGGGGSGSLLLRCGKDFVAASGGLRPCSVLALFRLVEGGDVYEGEKSEGGF